MNRGNNEMLIVAIEEEKDK